MAVRREKDRIRLRRVGLPLSSSLLLLFAAVAAAGAPARVRVAVPDAPEFAAVREAIAAHDWIAAVAVGTPADLHVAAGANGAVLRGAEGRALAGAAGSDAERVVAWAHRLLVAGLANPSGKGDVAFDFLVERVGDAPEVGPVRVVEPGAEIRWEVHNRSAAPVHVILFAVSPDRGVSLVHPYRGRVETVGPEERVDQSGHVSLPDGWRTTTDLLVALVTRGPIDAKAFLTPERLAEGLASLETRAWRTARHELVVRREVAAIAAPEAGSPVVANDAAPDAAAETRRARVRPRPRTSRFGVYFEPVPELGAIQRRLGKVRALCGRTGSACKIERLFPDSGFFELVRTGRRVGEGDTQTVAAAYEQAYQLRRGLEAARVEPFLELEMPSAPGEGLGAVAAAGAPSDPVPAAAAANDAWHLDQLGAPAAWRSLRAHGGREAGREAAGVVIAHVDTGLIAHPEVRDGAGAAGGTPGHDFVDDDDDATDPLAHSWPGDRPAHGTGSASLLASAPGCQLSGQAGCVHGVAPGADLAPLRAHRSAAHFHAGRLSRVIHAAAEGRLAQPVDLVSVAMAGPPGWSLWWASQRAEQRGIPVLAPSGSDVATVLWPARFGSTIAVAPSDVACRPWERASGGPAVDVAAPGVAVWRAGVDETGGVVNRPGSDAAFGVATATGASALWLARWSGDPRIEALRERGALTAALRDALRGSAWTPGARGKHAPGCPPGGWDGRFGAGIVSAASLLEQAPRAGAAPAAPVPSVLALPLFVSLHGDATAGDRAVRDYRRLFGLAPDAPLERVAYLEAELLHHYAMTPAVSEALDRALSPGAGPAAAAAARSALLRQGLSSSLRDALQAAQEADPESGRG